MKSYGIFQLALTSTIPANHQYYKMDVIAKGLLILPPSTHESGVQYRWIIPLPESGLLRAGFKIEGLQVNTHNPNHPSDLLNNSNISASKNQGKKLASKKSNEDLASYFAFISK